MLRAAGAIPGPGQVVVPVEFIKSVEFIVEHFERDEARGYRSRDRQFAIEILRPALKTAARSEEQP